MCLCLVLCLQEASDLGEAGACDAVALVMSMFPDHRLIQVEACRAVEALADGNEDNIQLLGEAVSCVDRTEARGEHSRSGELYRQLKRCVKTAVEASGELDGVEASGGLHSSQRCVCIRVAGYRRVYEREGRGGEAMRGSSA